VSRKVFVVPRVGSERYTLAVQKPLNAAEYSFMNQRLEVATD
jgi:hypothetical protein